MHDYQIVTDRHGKVTLTATTTSMLQRAVDMSVETSRKKDHIHVSLQTFVSYICLERNSK